MFATVICLVLPMCKSSLVFHFAVHMKYLCVYSVCAYSGVVGYLWCLTFCVNFVSCIVMMSGWVLCTRFFSFSILFLMAYMLI